MIDVLFLLPSKRTNPCCMCLPYYRPQKSAAFSKAAESVALAQDLRPEEAAIVGAEEVEWYGCDDLFVGCFFLKA